MTLVDVVYDLSILIRPEVIKSNSQRSRITSSVSNRGKNLPAFCHVGREPEQDAVAEPLGHSP
jgi:hypothetical protein